MHQGLDLIAHTPPPPHIPLGDLHPSFPLGARGGPLPVYFFFPFQLTAGEQVPWVRTSQGRAEIPTCLASHPNAGSLRLRTESRRPWAPTSPPWCEAQLAQGEKRGPCLSFFRH